MRERDDSIFDNQRFMQMGAQVQLIVLEFEYFGFLTRRSKSPEWEMEHRISPFVLKHLASSLPYSCSCRQLAAMVVPLSDIAIDPMFGTL